ncbi:hypothetical protein COOONC_21898 [Cooperia oncophora]
MKVKSSDVLNYLSDDYEDPKDKIYIGLRLKHGEFVWLSGVTCNYTHWNPDEPNNHGKHTRGKGTEDAVEQYSDRWSLCIGMVGTTPKVKKEYLLFAKNDTVHSARDLFNFNFSVSSPLIVHFSPLSVHFSGI